MTTSIWLVVAAGIAVVVGMILFVLSSIKVIKRWFVLNVRMPFYRRFRYRPARLKRDVFIVQEDD